MTTTIEVGDRVQGGRRGTEDHDEGVVHELAAAGATYDDEGQRVADEAMARVAWDSLVQTWHPVSLLELAVEAAQP